MLNEEFQKNSIRRAKKSKRRAEKFRRRTERNKKELEVITEQTADLTEFREETNAKLDTIIEENEILKELIGKHEVDIRRIQRRIV